MKLINEESKTVILPEMDVTSMPNSQVGVIQSKWNKVTLKNGLNKSQGPFIFELASGSKNFINLKRSWIVSTFKIVDEDGRDMPLTTEITKKIKKKVPALDKDGKPILDKDGKATTKEIDTEEKVAIPYLKYAPVEGIAGALIKSMDLFINGTLVENGSLAAYRWYLENQLSMSEEVRAKNLSLGGYWGGEEDYDEDGPNYMARCKMVAGSKVCQVACRLPLDLASVNRLIPAFTDIRLSTYLNSSQFLIDIREGNLTKKKHIELLDMHCLVNEWAVSEGYAAAVEKKLLTNGLHYPLNQVQMRSFYIEKDRTYSQHTVVFNGNQPKRLTMCLVSQKGYDGDYYSYPFKFHHYDLKNIAIDAGGVLYPGRPWNLNWETNQIAPGFIEMLEATGFARQNQTNSIDLKKFSNGGAIFSFELSPTVHDPDVMDLLSQNMNLTVHLEFNKPLPEGVYLIVMGESDGMLYIDQNRLPRINSI